MSAPGKGKELKIIERKVITLDDVKKSKRMIIVLHIIKHLGEVSEKGLTKLIYEMKEKGVDIGYPVVKIGKVVGSKDLHQDLLDLMYLDLIEKVPNKNKLRITYNGDEFLQKHGLPDSEIKPILELVDQLKPTIEAIEAEVEMKRRRP